MKIEDLQETPRHIKDRTNNGQMNMFGLPESSNNQIMLQSLGDFPNQAHVLSFSEENQLYLPKIQMGNNDDNYQNIPGAVPHNLLSSSSFTNLQESRP